MVGNNATGTEGVDPTEGRSAVGGQSQVAQRMCCKTYGRRTSPSLCDRNYDTDQPRDEPGDLTPSSLDHVELTMKSRRGQHSAIAETTACRRRLNRPT